VAAGSVLGILWGLWHAVADFVVRGGSLGAFWPVTFACFVLPLVAWRVLMTAVYARTQSGVVAQLMHFTYTGSLGAFIPLAAISPKQDALVYAILAVVLWLAVVGLVAVSPTLRALAPLAPPQRVDGR
jgi:hypothetical protein